MDANIILRHELIERIIRFEIHLDEIKEQFYYDNKNKQALIENFKIELEKLYEIVCADNSDVQFLQRFDIVQTNINDLHLNYLKILPRPSEPIELIRYERVIKEQVLALTEKKTDDDYKDISVSIAINEEIGEATEKDYLSGYKRYSEEEYRLILNKKNTDSLKQKLSDISTAFTVTIPRIDAPNTFRWPSLIHEICHYFLKDFFKEQNISTSFLQQCFGNAQKKNESDIEKVFNIPLPKSGITRTTILENWLSECFCDLLACVLIGPSFYFSQFIVFINTYEQTNIETHPPHHFRLSLMQYFIDNRRFDNLHKLFNKNKTLLRCCDLIKEIDEKILYNKNTFEKTLDLKNVCSRFINFFKNLLPLDKDQLRAANSGEINKKLLRFYKEHIRVLHPHVIKYLTDRLKNGLPIPSIRTEEKNNYKEIPTLVQEIFLASWLVKFSWYEEYKTKFREKEYKTKFKEYFKENIVRHDQAVLKSIQVSEWFDMLIDREDRGAIKLYEIEKKKKGKSRKISSVLTHGEIETLIYNDELKIIPLMYNGITILEKERKQIGTTSIDIRLGTSFQIFYPDQYGIIDFTDPENTYSFRNSSKRIDLDFLQSITIAPGQFMLAHSMEYVKLPNYICGNLEGRSSFARLGLEIHMTAGFIDPGFEGVITFEMYNAGPTTIKLYPGMRIGQLRFERNSNLPLSQQYENRDVKYRGLLEHNVSLQKKDIEVELIKNAIKNKDL